MNIRNLLLTTFKVSTYFSSLVLTTWSVQAHQMYPAPPRMQALQLSQPFTIVYSVAGNAYNKGSMLPVNSKITLSYDGKNLLYRIEDLNAQVIRTVLYDGLETYTMDSNSKIAEIQRGFDFARMPFCPLPGVGIPKMPFFDSGFPANYLATITSQAAPRIRSEPDYINHTIYTTPNQIRDYGSFIYADHSAYNPMSTNAGIASVVSTPSGNSLKVLWYDTFDDFEHLGKIWEYQSHIQFENIWLAKKIKMKYFIKLQETGKQTLFQSATYKLLSDIPKALEQKAYDPTTYLPDRANIGDMTGSTDRSFVYYIDKGSLQSQRRDGLKISEALAVNSKSPINTGLISVVIMGVVSVIWIFWRRASEAR